LRKSEIKVKISSDRSVSVEFANEISVRINREIRAFMMLLGDAEILGIVEVVPTYRAVLIHYEPDVLPYDELIRHIYEIIEKTKDIDIPRSEVVEVPVCYGGEYGPDIATVAKNAGISEKKVIEIHTQPAYLIYMLGFTPGFAYMGGMNKKIATPRLSSPRVRLEAGSVGIAGEQTGIYPIASPGGWQLIGRTPLVLFDPKAENPFLFKAGQRVRFYPITEQEYLNIKKEQEADA